MSPIIQRELRAEARNRWNAALRWLGAAACSLVTWALLWGAIAPPEELGPRLFNTLHRLVFVGIWVIVPALTADCLSRERREGTLDLLFLTPLSGEAIVFGKAAVHAIRGLTLWLATLPVLAVPLVLGGLTSVDVASAVLLQFAAMVLALAAGMVASITTRHAFVAIALAMVLSFLLARFYLWMLGGIYLAFMPPVVGAMGTTPSETGALLASSPNPLAVFQTITLSAGLGPAPPGWGATWIKLLVMFIGAVAGIFFLLIKFTARRVRSRWLERHSSAKQVRWKNFWLAPRFRKEIFVQHRRQTLERNPMGWLERYTTGRRLTKLGWCAAILLADSLVLIQSAPWMYSEFVQFWIAVLLTLHMAFASVALFRQEMESGALELLLVTPLPVRRLVAARLLAFWKRFFLPVAVGSGLCKLMIFLDFLDISNPILSSGSFLIINFLTVPVIGFLFSVSMKSFTGGFLLLAVMAVAVPVLVPEYWHNIFYRLLILEPPWFLSPMGNSAVISPWPSTALSLGQVCVALVCWVKLRRILEKRSFAADPEDAASPKTPVLRTRPA